MVTIDAFAATTHLGGEYMDVKLVMLFVLIGTIISLSNFNRKNLAKVKLGFDSKRWRVVVPRRRKS